MDCIKLCYGGTLSLPTLRDEILPKKIGLEVVRHIFLRMEFCRLSISEGGNFADMTISDLNV